MTSKTLFFRLLTVLTGTGLGLFLGWVLYQKFIIKTPAVPQKIANRSQAAQFVFHALPFYLPLRARSTSTHGTEAFSEFVEFQARHNSQGFRTPEYTTAHPPDTFRILVIGDSITWGHGVKMEQTFAAVLGKLLAPKCKNKNFEVIALGVQGHRAVDNLLKLLVHGQYLRPDLVLVQICQNDLDFYDYVNIFRFQHHSNFRKAYKTKESEVLSRNSFDRAIFSEFLGEMKKWSKGNSVPVSFVIFPLLDPALNGKNFNHYSDMSLHHFADFQNITEEIRGYGFQAIYLLTEFAKTAGDRYLPLSKTDGHPNVVAHQLAAESTMKFLWSSHLLSCESPVESPDPAWNAEYALRTEAESNWAKLNASYSEQLKFYQNLNRLHPDNAWIAMQLANVHFGMRKWNEAREIYRSIADLDKRHGAPWYHMALTTNHPEQKVRLLERMLEAVPDHTNSMKELQSIYLQKRNLRQACRLLLRLTEIPASQAQYDESKALYDKNRCAELSRTSENRHGVPLEKSW